MNRSLVDIVSDIALAPHDISITEEDVMQRVDELYVELHKKEDGIYWFYRNVEGQIELFKEQIDKLKKYTKTLKNAQERIKGLVIGAHQTIGELPEHTDFNPIKISKSAGAVDVIEEGVIPREYFIEVTETRLDKKRVLDELKNGASIPGVRLVQKDYVRGLK
jgi:hypothetical protein